MICPHCGAACDAFARTNGVDVAAEPVAGAVAICGYCCGLALVTADGDLRRPELHERGELLGRLDVLEALAALMAQPSIGDAVESARRIHAATRS